MSKILPFTPAGRNRRAMREQACDWVVKLSSGAGEAELRALHAWLDEHPAHMSCLLEAASMWDRVSVLAELSDVFPLEAYLAPRRAPRRLLAVAALAAVALLALLHQPVAGWLAGAWPVSPAPATAQRHETKVGERMTVALPDGSEVILNTDSLIDVAFSPRTRDIFLRRGEAHFTVAEDESRPFRVLAGGGMVEAVGTAFTVQRKRTEGLEVTVIEGVVNFTRLRPAEQAPADPAAAAPLAATEPIPLSAGEIVEVRAEDDVVQKQRIEPNELESRLAWRHGMLLFQGDPLQSVIEEVSRYTPIRFEIDESVRDIQVLGYFRTGDIEGILRTMQDTFGIEVERLSDDHIVLKAGE